MKNWKRAVTGILAVSVLTAGLALPGIAGAAATNQTETSKTQFKNGAVIPVSQSEAARLAAREKALSQYYITSGEKLAKAVSLLEGLAPAKTGLDARKHYFYRMDKALTGDYFQHVKAFLPYGQSVDRRLFPACESLHPRYGNAGGRIFYRER